MCGCLPYILSTCHLAESCRCIPDLTQNPQLNTRRNTAKIVVGLTLVFPISNVPYHAFWTDVICNDGSYIFCPTVINILLYSNYNLQYMYLISTCFLLINSCLNPVALFCTSSPFRQHLKRHLTCCCKINPPPPC